MTFRELFEVSGKIGWGFNAIFMQRPIEYVRGAVTSWYVSTQESGAAVRVREPGPKTLCCVLGEDTIISHYLTPLGCING